MKNCVGGGKNMNMPVAFSCKNPSEARIIRMLKKKRDKKKKKL